MKKLISGILICLMVTVFTVGGAVNAYAAGYVDTQRESSITIQYKLDGECFEGIKVKLYRIADMNRSGIYGLCGEFANYEVNVNGITSNAEWSIIADTLGAYATADQITPDHTGLTDANGRVHFGGLRPGLYMALYVDITEDDRIVTFDSFMIMLPFKDTAGNYDYDVHAYPKGHEFETGGDDIPEIQYQVVKQWKDSGYGEKRPESIEIDVFNGDILVYTQELSEDNNWTFRWNAKDDESKWMVVEKNVPEGYKVTFTDRETTIIITNEYEPEDEPENPTNPIDPTDQTDPTEPGSSDEETTVPPESGTEEFTSGSEGFEEDSGPADEETKPSDNDKEESSSEDNREKVPQTGDTANMWLYIVIMCFAGWISLIAAMWRRRME